MGINSLYHSLRTRIIPSEPFDLLGWRNWIVKGLIIFIAIGFPFAMVLTLPVLISEKNYGLIILDAAVWIFLVIQAFTKGHSYRANSYLFLAVLYTMMISYFVTLGPVHARPAWLVMCTALAALLFGLRAAIVSVVINAAILMILYALMGPENHVWAGEYTAPFGKWLMFVFNVSIITLFCCLPIGFLLERLDRSLSQERKARRQVLSERGDFWRVKRDIGDL